MHFLDISSGPNIIALALVIIVLIILVLLITLISKFIYKQKDNIEVLDDKKSNNENQKIKEIPIKKTSVIDDPATVKMSIEESKADLSNFNVKNNNNTIKDDEII